MYLDSIHWSLPQSVKSSWFTLTLVSLCSWTESNKRVIIDSDAMEPLIDLLSSENLEVQCNTCACITTLATGGKIVWRPLTPKILILVGQHCI